MQNESQNIEYKESWRDEYLKWICGFANAQGGTIYVGIDDKRKVVGVTNGKKLMEDIPNKVRDILGIIVDVNLHEKDGTDYLEIVTEPCPYPVSYRGEYHYRSGSTKQELKGAMLDQFLLKKRGKTWDAVPQPYLNVEDLDVEAINMFKEKAIRSQRMTSADLEGDNRELLEKLHLFEGDYLKRSAALLFLRDPERFITGAYIKIGFFRTDADLLYQDEIHGGLFYQVRQTMDLLTTKYMKSIIKYEDLQRIDELPVPRSALREAILNSTIHKSYGSNTPIQISVYEDRLMIWNAAVLPSGWTIESLVHKHSSQPFNPELANVFFRAGEIEAWGRGIERIISACKENGMETPEWRYDGSGLWIEFKYGAAQKLSRNHPETIQNNDTRLTDIQKNILNYLRQNPKATQKELASVIPHVSLGGVKYHLVRLKEIGLLKRVGGDRGGYWAVMEIPHW